MIFAKAITEPPTTTPKADPAKQIKVALGEKIPPSIRRAAQHLADAREARVAAGAALDELIAQAAAVPGGNRDSVLEEEIREAHAKAQTADARILRAMGQLTDARQAFERDNTGAIKEELAPLVGGLQDAVAIIEAARAQFLAAHRHCARNGLTSPRFLSALPQTDEMRKGIEQLARR